VAVGATPGSAGQVRVAKSRLLLGMAVALLSALAVCLITWPLMDVVTRHDNVRFE
jgi:hypothetical protein